MNMVATIGTRIGISFGITLATILTAWSPNAVAADEPPSLTHNPFSRPSSNVTISRHRVSGRDDVSGSTPVLRATMVGDAIRLANVAGRIVKAGDEIGGYELVGIYEEYAVFRKNGRAITVRVKPRLAEGDE